MGKKVKIFEQANYGGEVHQLELGYYDINEILPEHREIGSVKVPNGVIARAYLDEEGTGDFMEMAGDCSYVTEKVKDVKRLEISGSVKKEWAGEVAGTRTIDRIDFEDPYYWTKGMITIKGEKKSQKVELIVLNNGESLLQKEVILSEGQITNIPIQIEAMGIISVEGTLKSTSLFGSCGITMEVQLEYIESDLRFERAIFKPTQTGVQMIDQLYLTGIHEWESCVVNIRGDQQSLSSFMVTLLADGEIVEPLPAWTQLTGEEARVFSYPIHKKCAIMLVGYVTSGGTEGGGITISLIGYYH